MWANTQIIKNSIIEQTDLGNMWNVIFLGELLETRKQTLKKIADQIFNTIIEEIESDFPEQGSISDFKGFKDLDYSTHLEFDLTLHMQDVGATVGYFKCVLDCEGEDIFSSVWDIEELESEIIKKIDSYE